MKKPTDGPDGFDIGPDGAPLDPAWYLAWLEEEKKKKKKRAGNRKGNITLL